MHSVPVTLRTRALGGKPYPTTGLAPTPDSPLCVTPFVLWDAHAKKHSENDPDDPGFCITHRPTGLSLGSGLNDKALVRGVWVDVAEAQGYVFDTVDEAMAVLVKCEPDFPGWALAGDNEAAREACKTKFKWVMER